MNSPSEGLGPGVSWESMYDTRNKLQVEIICKELHVTATWKEVKMFYFY